MGVTGAEAEVKGFCDSWMITGVMACACITVALCASGVAVTDRSRGILADVMASPLPGWKFTAGYILAVALIASAVSLVVLAICFVYLAALGSWYLSVSDVFGCVGVTLLSVLSSTAVVSLIVSFVRTEGAFSGVNIIIGTVVGFLIGAYMPISTFPKAVQTVTLFIPGSYSAGRVPPVLHGRSARTAERSRARRVRRRIGKTIFDDVRFFRHGNHGGWDGMDSRGIRSSLRGRELGCHGGEKEEKIRIKFWDSVLNILKNYIY